MNFEPDADQQKMLDRAEVVLEANAGPRRAAALLERGEHDQALADALSEAGLGFGAQASNDHGLEATLLTEAVARHGGLIPFGVSAMICPAIDADLAYPVAIALKDQDKPIRFAPQARSLIVVDGDEVFVQEKVETPAVPVDSGFGYPFGRLRLDGGRRLDAGSAADVVNWWRVMLAAEMAGTMRSALDYTVQHTKTRHQFGRPIGSFQAIQHRLADCEVGVEGSRWLAYEAAAHGAPAESAACAAAYATSVATKIFYQTHQIMGARGFTFEHDLFVWSMRLQALRLELGGLGAHEVALTRARWMGGGSR